MEDSKFRPSSSTTMAEEAPPLRLLHPSRAAKQRTHAMVSWHKTNNNETMDDENSTGGSSRAPSEDEGGAAGAAAAPYEDILNVTEPTAARKAEVSLRVTRP